MCICSYLDIINMYSVALVFWHVNGEYPLVNMAGWKIPELNGGF